MAAIGAGVSDMSETITSRSKGFRFRPLGLTGAIVLAMSVGLMISASSAAAGAGEYISGVVAALG
jgi:hypothetical protein